MLLLVSPHLCDLEQDDRMLHTLQQDQGLGFDVHQSDLFFLLVTGDSVNPLVQSAQLIDHDLQVGVRLCQLALKVRQADGTGY